METKSDNAVPADATAAALAPTPVSAVDQKTVMVLLAPEKIKVIVIMDVPDGSLLCCRLEDMTLTPEKGSSYVIDGRLFDVVRAVEVIGTRLGTDEQLLALLNLASGEEQGMVRIANMRNIGKEAEAGSVICATRASTLSFTAAADRLVYLKLRQVSGALPGDPMVRMALRQLEKNGFTSGSTKDEAKAGETSGDKSADE